MKNPNAKQKLTLRIAAGAIAALLIFPPMRGVVTADSASHAPAGHQWFYLNETANFGGIVGVNWPVLLTLWFGVLAVSALVYLSLHED